MGPSRDMLMHYKMEEGIHPSGPPPSDAVAAAASQAFGFGKDKGKDKDIKGSEKGKGKSKDIKGSEKGKEDKGSEKGSEEPTPMAGQKVHLPPGAIQAANDTTTEKQEGSRILQDRTKS